MVKENDIESATELMKMWLSLTIDMVRRGVVNWDTSLQSITFDYTSTIASDVYALRVLIILKVLN